MKPIEERVIRVYYEATLSNFLPWKFRPLQPFSAVGLHLFTTVFLLSPLSFVAFLFSDWSGLLLHTLK